MNPLINKSSLLLCFAGQISTTEPLNSEEYPSYVFTVVAFDCAEKRSSPVLVTVKVQKMCTPGWKGMSVCLLVCVCVQCSMMWFDCAEKSISC